MDYRFGLLLFVLVNLLDFARTKRPFVIEIYKMDCIVLDRSFSPDLTCTLDRKGTYPVVSVFFTLAKVIPEFSMRYKLDVIKMDKKKMNIAEVMLDGCKFLSSFYSNFIYGKFFKRIQMASNLPKKCPMASKRYEIRNYSVIPDEYPLGSPALTYQMSLTFYRANNTVAHFFNSGAVVYKERK